MHFLCFPIESSEIREKFIFWKNKVINLDSYQWLNPNDKPVCYFMSMDFFYLLIHTIF